MTTKLNRIMDRESQAKRIVDRMMDKDYFSQWLGIERVEEGPGYCTLKMTVRKEMLNGFGIAHGGITYSFADSALAFASNSHGQHAVSIDTQIAHTRPLKAGQAIMAKATEVSRTRTLGRYDISITDEEEQLVALFRGTVYIKRQNWEIE